MPLMDEGRKRVIAIVAGILVATHLRPADELFDSKASPKTEAMVAAAVQWAERIMKMIDNVFGKGRRNFGNLMSFGFCKLSHGVVPSKDLKSI